jgi:ABC-type transport system involved in cytochrome bd biosynthesis fused ATPase/permease subunit
VANGQTEIPSTVILPPATALQLGGQSLHQITAALGAQPLMLTVVLLNLVFAGVGGYFLLRLEAYRAANLTALIELVRSCVLETAPLGANREKIDRLEQDVDALQRNQSPEP